MEKKTKRRIVLLVSLGLGALSVSVLGILVSLYPSHVESRFQDCLENLGIAGHAKTVSSTCLGVESDRIRILAVLYSRIFNEDPFPNGAGRRSNYKHGDRFNYQKIIDYGRRDVRLLAYWSVRDDSWHAGGVVMDDTGKKAIWQCVPGTCPVEEHGGRSGAEFLLQYEPTLGSLFADFHSPAPSSDP